MMHNEEFHNLYPSPDIIMVTKERRMKLLGHVVRMGETRSKYILLVAKHEGKEPPGSLMRTWEDDINVVIKEMGFEGVELALSGSEQGPTAGSCKRNNETLGSMKRRRIC
jgi:hypothetical protein